MKHYVILGLIALAGSAVGVMVATIVSNHSAAVNPAAGSGGTTAVSPS